MNTIVNDRNWALIVEGDSASLATDSNSELRMTARVVNKSQAADPVTGACWVEIASQNPKSLHNPLSKIFYNNG